MILFMPSYENVALFTFPFYMTVEYASYPSHKLLIIFILILDIPGIENVTIYPYDELRSATGDFSIANKVGEGGFGSVYRVTCIYFYTQPVLIIVRTL